MIHRTKTRPVKVGNLTIGGSNQLFIQSMTSTKTHDVEATVEQIKRLEEAGCQIVRVACPDNTLNKKNLQNRRLKNKKSGRP